MVMSPGYFSERELKCRCGCKLYIHNKEFLALLTKIRISYGKPMIITSAVRCSRHNLASGGSPQSYHLEGRAVDVACPISTDRYRLIKYAIECGARGIGIGSNFIHIDDRDTAEKIWLYV